MEQIDVVFLGYPIWNIIVPRAVQTFLSFYGFSGKTVIPSVAHGTGGTFGSVRDMSCCFPEDCTVLEPIGVYRPDVQSCQADIEAWIEEMGLEN